MTSSNQIDCSRSIHHRNSIQNKAGHLSALIRVWGSYPNMWKCTCTLHGFLNESHYQFKYTCTHTLLHLYGDNIIYIYNTLASLVVLVILYSEGFIPRPTCHIIISAVCVWCTWGQCPHSNSYQIVPNANISDCLLNGSSTVISLGSVIRRAFITSGLR